MLSQENRLSFFLSFASLLGVLLIWQFSTLPQASRSPYGIADGNAEYQRLMGRSALASTVKSDFPTPSVFARNAIEVLHAPFHNNGPNDRGIGWQLGASLLRVMIGYGLATLVAVPLGFVFGLQLFSPGI